MGIFGQRERDQRPSRPSRKEQRAAQLVRAQAHAIATRQRYEDVKTWADKWGQ